MAKIVSISGKLKNITEFDLKKFLQRLSRLEKEQRGEDKKILSRRDIRWSILVRLNKYLKDHNMVDGGLLRCCVYMVDIILKTDFKRLEPEEKSVRKLVFEIGDQSIAYMKETADQIFVILAVYPDTISKIYRKPCEKLIETIYAYLYIMSGNRIYHLLYKNAGEISRIFNNSAREFTHEVLSQDLL